MAESTERRLHARYAIPVSIFREEDGSLCHHTIRNVSLGGAFVLLDSPMEVGARLVLFLDVPKKSPLSLSPGTDVEVVRLADDRMDIRFLDPPRTSLTF